MYFDAIGVPDRKAQQFIRSGIMSIEDLVGYWPRKYNDRSSTTGVRNKDQESVFIMHVASVKLHRYTKTVVQATGTIAVCVPFKILTFLSL